MNVEQAVFVAPQHEEAKLIVNVTPDNLASDSSNPTAQQEQQSQQSQASSRSRTSRSSKESKRRATSPGNTQKLAPPRRTSTDTVPTEAETEAETISPRNSQSTIATEASTQPDDISNARLKFYKSDSQRKLQEQLQQQHHPPEKSTSFTQSLSSILRLEEEEMEEGLHDAQVRSSIETARRNLSSMRKWNTPYDIDPPRRIRLAAASSKSVATTDSSSTFVTSSTESDPMIMEQQIWAGIEALMADAFSEGGESVCTEDVLPKSLLRAMSNASLSVATSNPHSNLTPEEIDEIQMAQAALNSFMDMLLPEEEKSSLPSLETMRDSESQRRYEQQKQNVDQIAMAEVALHNFMDVLLHDLEQEDENKSSSSDHSSKVQILDLFQWSLKVNVDAQEKIRYLESERSRLEEERQRELEELMETERRLERERARRRIEEEKRRRKIRELEQHLAQEQRALATANRKAYHAMKRNQYRQPPIPEEDELWAATPGGKPVVISKDEHGSNDPLQQQRKQPRGLQQHDLQRSSGEISAESDNAMQYIVTSSNEPSPQKKAPELEQEGTLPRQANVKRMPSWTFIGGKGIVMASTDSVESASHAGSSMSNHLPSSFHKNDAIRNLSDDSDSSDKKGRRRRYSNGTIGRTMSAGSSLDMPDLASINEGSVLNSVDSPPYISTGGDLVARQYPGGVPRVAPATLKAEPSLRQRFKRVSSSGRIGIVSASGDVFTDDVSRYSFSKFFVEPADETKEEEQPEVKDRHTELISVGSAGDIHQLVGSTVRFNEISDSSSQSDDSSSSESEEVTMDSDLHRDAQTDAMKPVPHVSRKYGSGGKRRLFGGRIKKSMKAMRNRGKCVTNSWFCESANKRYGDISKQSKKLERHSKGLEKLSSQQCLLHAEDSPYDRAHVLEPTRLSIDDTGFVIDRR